MSCTCGRGGWFSPSDPNCPEHGWAERKIRLEEFATRLDEVGAELVGLPCCPAIIRRGGYFEIDSDSIEDIERAVIAMEELVNG